VAKVEPFFKENIRINTDIFFKEYFETG